MAATMAAFPSNIWVNLNNCTEYRSGKTNGEQQAQKFAGGKCFYYYANNFKRELLIYEPQPEQPNIGTLTEVELNSQYRQIVISRHAVKDLRKGPHPDDTKYLYVHEIEVNRKERESLIRLFQIYSTSFKSEIKI